jgi:hypothetical protein
MDRDHEEKIEQIKSLDANDPNISPRCGVCRFEPGEDGRIRRAKEEKVAEALRAREGRDAREALQAREARAREAQDLDGFVPAQPVYEDGEYIATKRAGTLALHCVAWRDHGQWRRLSDWSEQMPESAVPHLEILFAPEAGGGGDAGRPT